MNLVDENFIDSYLNKRKFFQIWWKQTKFQICCAIINLHLYLQGKDTEFSNSQEVSLAKDLYAQVPLDRRLQKSFPNSCGKRRLRRRFPSLVMKNFIPNLCVKA